MTLYYTEVTILVPMVVLADDSAGALRIANKCVFDELDNSRVFRPGFSWSKPVPIDDVNQLPSECRRAIPWGEKDDRMVYQILAAKKGES